MKNIFQYITSKKALAILLVLATFTSCESEGWKLHSPTQCEAVFHFLRSDTSNGRTAPSCHFKVQSLLVTPAAKRQSRDWTEASLFDARSGRVVFEARVSMLKIAICSWYGKWSCVGSTWQMPHSDPSRRARGGKAPSVLCEDLCGLCDLIWKVALPTCSTVFARPQAESTLEKGTNC